MGDKYAKIIQVSGFLFSVVTGYCIKVIFEFFAVLFGPVAKIYGMEIFRHGIPVSLGLLCFFIIQFHPKVQKWLMDVVIEIDKVVWPTKKDTFSMTAVVCFVLILSGIVLGLFDLSAATLMRFIMN